MKKIIACIAIALLPVSMMAQTTGSTTLKVTLHQVQSITVNHAEVEMNLNTVQHYKDGLEKPVASHLTVFSTGGFKVNVKSNDPHFLKGNDRISLSDMTITPRLAAGHTLNQVTFAAKELGMNSRNIITGQRGGVDKNFDVIYKIKGDYINAAPGTYSASIMYEITPL